MVVITVGILLLWKDAGGWGMEVVNNNDNRNRLGEVGGRSTRWPTADNLGGRRLVARRDLGGKHRPTVGGVDWQLRGTAKCPTLQCIQRLSFGESRRQDPRRT